MTLFGFGSKKKTVEELIESVSYADRCPLEEMKEFIEAGQRDAKVVSVAIEQMRNLAFEAPDLWRGWVSIVCGEFGAKGAGACVKTVGRSVGEDADDDGLHDDLLLPSLLQNVCSILPRACELVHFAENASVRAALYAVLDGVVLRGTKEKKTRLVTFCRERWEIEREDVEGKDNAVTVAVLLHHLGEDVRHHEAEIRRWGKDDERYVGEANDLKEIMSGELDSLSDAKRLIGLGWRENAERIWRQLQSRSA